jgi:DNA modification methylase
MNNDITVIQGDCRDILYGIHDNSIDAIITDPPYELGFMGKSWDSTGIAYDPQVWAHCYHILKPGGHLLAFGGTRTWHRLACAIQDCDGEVGFEIRDSIAWLYGSGFPKSLDVSKAIDRARQDNPDWRRVGAWLKANRLAADMSTAAVCAAIGAHGATNHGGAMSNWENGFSCPTWEQWLSLKALLSLPDDMDAEVWRLNGRKGTPGNERPDREVSDSGSNQVYQPSVRVIDAGTPVLDAAKQWQGWGTALKPAFEPVVVARKPLQGTVAANVQAWGTGAINVDACRVETSDDLNGGAYAKVGNRSESTSLHAGSGMNVPGKTTGKDFEQPAGRWPANVLLDDTQAAALDQQSGVLHSGGYPHEGGQRSHQSTYGKPNIRGEQRFGSSEGGASRFFPTFKYCAKAPRKERPVVEGVTHPTVKPLSLMQWLCRLVCPPGGLILDPFAGTGTTGQAAQLEGMRAILIELEPSYIPLIEARLAQ